MPTSGHGGQRKDVGGDESDGRDETICLYDGQLSDDVVWEMLAYAAKRSVRVWMVTDSCNSGTNYRAVHDYVKAGKGIPGLSLIHWGGCADGMVSFGSASGGEFTTAMVDAWEDVQSYDSFWNATNAKMPAWKQKPTIEKVGADFGYMEAFR